ncbi:MAG: hypothetical protein C0595_00400 [Marinilabiliales bacterium]|nr:MAG: hypothetical protein C0595_00400 [Marinilabiliales bacterium]
MNRYKIYIFISGIIFLILFSSSCKVNRSALKKPLKDHGFDYLYTKMTENQVNFKTLNTKIDITYLEENSKTGLKGQMRMVNDSLIWVSFSPALGIEAARVLLTKDSVKFINRLNKTYFTGKYKLLDSLLNTTIEYSILQSMLLGNDLTQYDVNKFKASIDGGYYRITIKERRKIRKYIKSGEIESKVLVQNIWLYPDNFRIRRIELRELGDDSKKLNVYYDEYLEMEGQLFPKNMRIEISANKNITMDINFSKIRLNIDQNYPFNIPSKYDLLIH